MTLLEGLEDRIRVSVTGFAREQMGLQPTAVLVNLQDEVLFVMLQGITFPAEKACAEDEEGRTLLDDYYARTFAAGKQVLEGEIEGILGKRIKRSTLRVDSLSGSGVVQVMFGDHEPEAE